MKEPLVSVLVPVYNVERYLEKCLDSIVAQTLYHIEIICVNDGSTDGSLEILEKYKARDKRIKVVNKPNGGLPSARNAGLDVARGKYVGFVDSDDYIDKNMFQKLYETAQKNKSELVICGANIFPENPRPNNWLYNCLSPEHKHYDEFDPEILFGCIYTTPFLWRTLIKRSLIENYNLRLDEKIMVGEDKLFQVKVYPKAKGITIIPDKLYHYCWYRENSMMNENVHKISSLSQKVKAHRVLVEDISEVLLKDNADYDMKLAFLKWGIPFVYADFISLPLRAKTELAEELVNVWKGCGYYNAKWEIESWIREQFDYICMFVQQIVRPVTVSVIMPVSDKTEYIQDALDSILMQSEDLECILVNNGTSDETYSIMHRYLFKDRRIRLYNMEQKAAYSEALNDGIDLAVGKYVMFCEADGWYKSEHALEAWVSEAENLRVDLCASVPVIDASNIFPSDAGFIYNIRNITNKEYMANDFHHVLYRREFLNEHPNIRFKDNSIITGFPFLMMAVSEAGEKAYYMEQVYVRRHLHRPDWISTEKCEKVLRGLDRLMKYSSEKQDANIQVKVLTVLNDDYYKNIIINNTSITY